MNPVHLTLAAIDNTRHLVTSEDIVKAVAFAARAAHSDRTSYRFVTALVMTDMLTERSYWPVVLRAVRQLEEAELSPHIHKFEEVASWPAGPDGETGTLRTCSCGESITANTTFKEN